MTQKPVLISGGGLASLLLARCLLRYRVPFQIFERDASPSFRGQGYRLRLSTEGLDAIESVLGPEGFPKFWEATGKTAGGGLVRYNAVTGETLDHEHEQPPSSGDETAERARKEQLTSRGGLTIGIARGEMRKLFMEGCEPYIQWSKTVTGYERLPDGVRAIFADGTKSDEGSMLIGGEGIYSRVSKQLSNGVLKVFDLGARGIHGQAPASSFKGLGEGVFQIVDETHPDGGSVSVITNVRPGNLDEEGLVFGWTMGGTPGTIEAPNNNFSVLGKPAADMAKGLTAKWHPKFRPLFDNIIESDAAFWKITCSRPTGVPEWPNDPRVTVIGDAVHSMTPAGGIGANTAVRDSALLGKLIGEAGGYREGATAEYEKEMRVYGSEAVAKSYGMAKFHWKANETLKELEGPRSGALG